MNWQQPTISSGKAKKLWYVISSDKERDLLLNLP